LAGALEFHVEQLIRDRRIVGGATIAALLMAAKERGA
jgi:hypothetical protein